LRLLRLHLFYILFTIPFLSVAQKEWSIRHFGVQDGLPFEVVRDIALSKDGATVWFATWGGGVCGLTGTTWTYLDRDRGLPSDSVRAILPVEDNGLWIGGLDVLSYFNGKTITNFTKENTEGLLDDVVFSLCEMPGKNIWMGTANGHILATSATLSVSEKRTWRVVLDPSISKGESIRAILRAQDGKVWIAVSRTGLFSYNGVTWQQELNARDAGNYSCRTLDQTPDGRIWTGGTPNLLVKEESEWKAGPDNVRFVNWICSTPHHGVWIGDHEGIDVYHKGKWSPFVLDPNEPSIFVEIIRALPDGSIWAGTRQGVYRIVPSLWQRHALTAEDKEIASSLLIAHPNYPPMGVDKDNQVIVFENNQWHPKSKLPDTPDYRGMFTEVVNGHVWIMCASQVLCLDLASLAVTRSAPVMTGVRPHHLHLSPQDELWSLGSSGVFRLSGDTWIPEPQDPTYPRTEAYSMECLPDGSCWLGLKNRVEYWNHGVIESFEMGKTPFPGISPPLSSIRLSADNSLWFSSTSTGVVIRKNNQWTRLGIKEGLYSHRISVTYEGLDGTVLLGYTNNGLSMLHHNYWSLFKAADGVPSGSVLSIGESPRGTYWATVENAGIISFFPRRTSPITLLDNIPTELNPSQTGELSFHSFDLDNYTPDNEMMYSWRIDPEPTGQADSAHPPNDWSPFHPENRMDTPVLAPGKYIFQVRAADKEGDIDPHPASAIITILPPLWQRVEVLIPGVLLISAVIFLLVLWFRKHYALEQSEERYRSLVEHSPNGIIVHSERVIVFLNPEAARLLRAEKIQDLIGKNMIQLIYADPNEVDPLSVCENLEPTKVLEKQMIRLDGSLFDAEVMCQKVIYMGKPAIQMVFLDITEHKQAELALIRSEERFRLAMDATRDGLWDWDIVNDKVYYSPGYYEMLKYQPGEFVEKSSSWVERIHPEDRNRALSVNMDCIENRCDSFEVEFRMKAKDGSWVWILGRGKAIQRDHAGQALRLVGTHTDISERKRSEEERKTLETHLQASQKLESLGVLAGGIAHDFNNLLMGILGNAGLALQDLSRVSPVRPFIDEIEKATLRAADLTRQMLAYSGKGHFQIKIVDISEVTRELTHLLESSISKKAHLKLQLTQGLPAIRGDIAQLQQIIINLIMNASEALNEEFGGEVIIRTGIAMYTQKDLTESRLPNKPSAGRYVFLEVTDTGCGMDADTCDKLFDPFFTTKFTGRGLGMSAVLGIVRGHQGAIFVRSKDGAGTTIRVLFPALDTSAATIKETNQNRNGDKWQGRGTILLVDDEHIVQTVAKTILERLGFDVLLASDGIEAVEIFHQRGHEIDCVLLDLSMPRMDGEQTLVALRKINQTVPVILSSGYAEAEIEERFKIQGISAFIQKPYQVNALKQTIQDVLKI
jgi:PAS domain S-box-containing protein